MANPRNLKGLDLVKEDLKKEDSHFSVEAMAVAVADKKNRRAKKGLEFNCFVLDGDADEFADFVSLLEKNKKDIFDKTRFQIVYRTRTVNNPPHHGYHWSAADVQIKNNKLSFYLIDAAGVLPVILECCVLIKKCSPTAIIRYSGGMIQNSPKNCATFSLDHVYRLAKIQNLHEKLEAIPEDACSIDSFLDVVSQYGFDREWMAENITYIPVVRLSIYPEFGPLFRNMQSVTTLKEVFFKKELNLSGNDQQSLVDYVNTRIIKQGKKEQNHAMIKKRESIRAKAVKFLQSPSMNEKIYQKIQKNRLTLDENLFLFSPKKPTNSPDPSKNKLPATITKKNSS